jgi:hypothetical protein
MEYPSSTLSAGAPPNKDGESVSPDFFERRGIAHEGHLEKEKESDRRQLIAVASRIMTEHFRRLEIPLRKTFPRECFCFLSEEEFDMRFPDMKGAAGRHGEGEGIFLVERGTMAEKLLTLLHEMTHEVAIRQSEVNPHGDIMVSHNGYKMRKRVANDLQGRELRSYFDALNEAVVEMSAIHLVTSFQEEIEQAGVSREEIEHALERRHYRDAVMVVQAIILGMVGDDDRAQRTRWGEIERGQYTGEMKWVREIDRVFGAGSLRVLDALIATPTSDADREKNALILRYFQSKSAEDRSALRSEILD